MFSQIPPIRLIIYVLFLGLIPLVLCVFHHFSVKKTVLATHERLEQMRYHSLLQEKRQASNQAMMAHYRDADHFYIDKQLETITLLEPEIESLQRLTQKENFPGDDSIQKRLEHLTSPANAIVFTEGVVQSHDLYQETTETLSHPVEVNTEDLKKLLARIEGVPMGSDKPAENKPQLLILDFKIERKQQTENLEVFLLNLKLLKREYL